VNSDYEVEPLTLQLISIEYQRFSHKNTKYVLTNVQNYFTLFQFLDLGCVGLMLIDNPGRTVELFTKHSHFRSHQ